MFCRPLIAPALVMILAATISSAEERPAVHGGDIVVVKLSGKLAQEYARLAGDARGQQISAEEITITISARIVRRLDDGRYRVDHLSETLDTDRPPSLLTFSTVVDAAQFKARTIPAQTAVSSSPAESSKSKLISQPHQQLYLNLSSLQDVTLRSWKIDQEAAK